MPKVYTYFNQKDYEQFRKVAKKLGVSEYELLQGGIRIYIKVYAKQTAKEFWDIMSNAP